MKMTRAFRIAAWSLAVASRLAGAHPEAAGGAGSWPDRLKAAPLSGKEKIQVRDAVAMHDYVTAETILVKAIDAKPQSAPLLIAAAAVFLMDRNPLNAAIAFKKADRIHALEPPDRLSLCMAYIGMGKSAWAKPELERLASADAKNMHYVYWLGRVEYDDRNYAAAVEKFRAVTANDPHFLRAWDNLALSLEGLGKLDEAVPAYQQAIGLNREQHPPSAWPPLNLGTLMTKMGKTEEAQEYLAEAVRYDPSLAVAHYRLGMNLHRKGDEAGAVTELEQSAQLDADDPEPVYTLSQIYRAQGDAKKADEALQQFQTLKAKRREPAAAATSAP